MYWGTTLRLPRPRQIFSPLRYPLESRRKSRKINEGFAGSETESSHFFVCGIRRVPQVSILKPGRPRMIALAQHGFAVTEFEQILFRLRYPLRAKRYGLRPLREGVHVRMQGFLRSSP